MPRARSGAFWCHFRLGCSPSCPSSILIASSRPSRRVCRLQRRRSARRSSLSARLPGLPSRWPAYLLVRPRGTCTARAAVVGCCARPWGRITLQWCNGGPPGPFERRDNMPVLGRPTSVMRAPHSLNIPSRRHRTLRVQSPSDMEGNARIYANGQLPGPLSVQPRAADLRRGRHERRPASPPVPCFRCRFCWLLSASAPTILPGRR